jgi:starch-binding outer membrane protein, SusD/RagB family
VEGSDPTNTALLARVYLYKKNWSKAEAEATAVIGSGMYTLPADPATVFLKNSQEAIWQLFPVNPGLNTLEGNQLLPSPISNPSFPPPPTYYITDTLLRSFETGDKRKTSWTGLRIYPNGGNSYYYPTKYKVRTGGTLTEYYVVFRLAEQFLIRAEARAQQNLLAEAILDIDTVRHRAGLPGTMAASQTELLSAIEHERQIELFAEWGHRWYDLIRTDRATTILGTLKPATWQATDTLWPIPILQIRLNPRLTQNPGYN